MENKITPLFSVIVPVYNAERTISKTVDSILRQSFDNFELILINDGSKDNSLEICKSYADKDFRVKIYDYPNGGVSCARNRGLDKAIGIYICFVDADDEVYPDWLQYYSKYTDVELMIEGHIALTEQSRAEISDTDGLYLEDKFVQGIEIICKKGRLNMPWNKCYRRSVIKENNMSFLQGCDLFEDLIFTLQYIQKVHSLQIISYCGYEYRMYNSILTHKFNEPDKFLSWCNKIMDEVLVFSNMYDNISVPRFVFTRLFNAASWYVVLFYKKLNYDTRGRFYNFLTYYRDYLNVKDTFPNRMPFLWLSNRNRLVDIVIGFESIIYKILKHE